MRIITSKHILQEYEKSYKIKIKSKKYSLLQIFILNCTWNEIKKDKFIIEATINKISNRFDISSNIILFLKDFKKDYPIYVFIKEQHIMLPIIDIKKDNKTKTLILYVE